MPGNLTSKAEAEKLQTPSLKKSLMRTISFRKNSSKPVKWRQGKSLRHCAGIQKGTIYSVMSGFSSKNMRTLPLLNFIAEYSSNPVERTLAAQNGKWQNIEIKTIPSGSFSEVIFRTISEMHVVEPSLNRFDGFQF
ncbi:hypothetical protein JW992_14910 [candidate division KSB1 bacterium]|nr:hypothetical protein [candidate division KSB1 bacterium]